MTSSHREGVARPAESKQRYNKLVVSAFEDGQSIRLRVGQSKPVFLRRGSVRKRGIASAPVQGPPGRRPILAKLPAIAIVVTALLLPIAALANGTGRGASPTGAGAGAAAGRMSMPSPSPAMGVRTGFVSPTGHMGGGDAFGSSAAFGNGQPVLATWVRPDKAWVAPTPAREMKAAGPTVEGRAGKAAAGGKSGGSKYGHKSGGKYSGHKSGGGSSKWSKSGGGESGKYSGQKSGEGSWKGGSKWSKSAAVSRVNTAESMRAKTAAITGMVSRRVNMAASTANISANTFGNGNTVTDTDTVMAMAKLPAAKRRPERPVMAGPVRAERKPVIQVSPDRSSPAFHG